MKKNSLFSKEMRAIGGVHALERKRPGAEVGGQAAPRKERVDPVPISQVPPAEASKEVREEAPLQKKKRLRMADGSEPSYVAKANAEERARGKKPCSGTGVVAGLGED